MFHYVNKKRISEFPSQDKLGMRLAYLGLCIEFKWLTLSWVFGRILVFRSGGRMANQSECVEKKGTCNEEENKTGTLSSVFVLERKLQ